MSTDPEATLPRRERYILAPGLALRREPFGGLAYSHVTRRLQLIRPSFAVDVALRFQSGATLPDVVRQLAGDSRQWAPSAGRILQAIISLVNAGILVPCAPGDRPRSAPI